MAGSVGRLDGYTSTLLFRTAQISLPVIRTTCACQTSEQPRLFTVILKR